MVDRQSKDFYQQQLAQAAWANLRGTTGVGAGYGAAAGPNTMTPGGAMVGGHGATLPGGTSTNPYENYMQQLQQFAGLAQGTAQATNPAMFAGAAGAANFLNNGAKEMAPGFSSPFGFPPGHPMHFPGIGNYRPLPAHNPLPAHMKNTPGTSSATNPLPAHMRSNPYQQAGAYGLTPAGTPYGYQMPGQQPSGFAPPVTESSSRSRQQFHDQSQVSGAQFGGSKSAPQSRSASQESSRRGAVNGATPTPASLTPSEVTAASAYSQLQQLQAAYSQATSQGAKENNKKSGPGVTSNNNYPYPYSAPATAGSSGQVPPNQGFSSNSGLGSDPTYDQIAAALLNRFSGQFSPQLLMEMSNMGQQQTNKTQNYQQLQTANQTLPTGTQSKQEHVKQTSKQTASTTSLSQTTKSQLHQALVAEKADKRPPDPGMIVSSLKSNGPSQTVRSLGPQPGTRSPASLVQPPRTRSPSLVQPPRTRSPSSLVPLSNSRSPASLVPLSDKRSQASFVPPPSTRPPVSLVHPPSAMSPAPVYSSPQPSVFSNQQTPYSPEPPQGSPSVDLNSSGHSTESLSICSPPASVQMQPNSQSRQIDAVNISSPGIPSNPPSQTVPILEVPIRTPEHSQPPSPEIVEISPPVSDVEEIPKLEKPKSLVTNNQPLAHSVASQLSSPSTIGPPSVSSSVSLTSKLKDLQNKMATKPTNVSSNVASNKGDDTGQLKGLWKMQAQFQQKTVKLKLPPVTSSSRNSPLNTTSVSTNNLPLVNPPSPPPKKDVSIIPSFPTVSSFPSPSTPSQSPPVPTKGVTSSVTPSSQPPLFTPSSQPQPFTPSSQSPLFTPSSQPTSFSPSQPPSLTPSSQPPLFIPSSQPPPFVPVQSKPQQLPAPTLLPYQSPVAVPSKLQLPSNPILSIPSTSAPLISQPSSMSSFQPPPSFTQIMSKPPSPAAPPQQTPPYQSPVSLTSQPSPSYPLPISQPSQPNPPFQPPVSIPQPTPPYQAPVSLPPQQTPPYQSPVSLANPTTSVPVFPHFPPNHTTSSGLLFPQFPVPPGALLHTPRSPPHPPPRHPAPLYTALQSPARQTYPLHPVEQDRTNNRPPPIIPSSSQLSPHQPPYLPPLPNVPHKPVLDQPKPGPIDQPVQSISNQNYDRMEVKNSGIPGPGAITWKRKSVEDTIGAGNSKSKKRKIVHHNKDLDDPYSFDDEEVSNKSNSSSSKEHHTNGGSTLMGPLYKKKAAMMLRDDNKLAAEIPIIDSIDKYGESDESSRSSGIGSPMKKKIKRPKLEEWSVKKETKSLGKEKNSEPDESRVNSENPGSNPAVRKGPLWGLPIVPKPPQKTAERQKTPKLPEPPVVVSPGPASKSAVNNVWLQAFGGPSVNKSKKKTSASEQSQNDKGASSEIKKTGKNDGKNDCSDDGGTPVPKTILDIPPEVRRKPKPDFGGLIHFSPDWRRTVRRHHERCRIPVKIENSQTLQPKILAGETLTPKRSYEDQQRKEMVSPPDLMAIEKERLERSSIVTATSTSTNNRPGLGLPSEDDLSGELPSIVETILANRKKLREVAASAGRMGSVREMRMYKEKRRKVTLPKPDDVIVGLEGNLGLIPTPGLPLLTEDTKDVLIGSGFGNFRRYTLLKYLESRGDSDGGNEWHLDTKTRRQSSQTKPVTSFKEIFGIDPPVINKSVSKKCSLSNSNVSDIVTPPVTKKERKKKETKQVTSSNSTVSEVTSKVKKFVPKEIERVNTNKHVEDDDGAYSQEVGDPTEDDNNLQGELGGFALDLLDDNSSWTKRVTISNLVIWEPAEEQPNTVRKKKGKKKRSKKSGLDFSTQKRKSKSAGSVPVSRAGTPVHSEEVHEVTYTMDNVISESSRWVVDKNAGETILHRASKMGYPDVASYALDRLGMAPMDKDYAGLTPLHKAAFKGQDINVKVLLKYGADASAGVKGTRALHEAIDGASAPTVRTLLSYGADPLLHDYSGNMPLDLANNHHDPDIRNYLGNLLSDLHGRAQTVRNPTSGTTTINPSRWNVSQASDFHDPKHPESGIKNTFQEEDCIIPGEKDKCQNIDNFIFEMSSLPLPPTYQLLDRPGEWVLYKDLKEFSKKKAGGKYDIRTKGDLIELKKSEFIKTSHCSLLDRRYTQVRYHERPEEDIVILVKIDKFVRKIFNSELVQVPKC